MLQVYNSELRQHSQSSLKAVYSLDLSDKELIPAEEALLCAGEAGHNVVSWVLIFKEGGWSSSIGHQTRHTAQRKPDKTLKKAD